MDRESHIIHQPEPSEEIPGEILQDPNLPLPYEVRKGVWVTDLPNVGAAFALKGLVDRLRGGQTVEIPSLGITLTAEHLTNKEE